jgi:hypothetical protein
MTYAEARAAYHTSHLWWRTEHHCWYASPSRHVIRRKHEPATAPTAPQPMIMFPTLVQGAGVEAQMLNVAPSVKWPSVILDVDAATASADPPDECCWPPLDPPAENFSERWQAVPSYWFTARMEQRP